MGFTYRYYQLFKFTVNVLFYKNEYILNCFLLSSLLQIIAVLIQSIAAFPVMFLAVIALKDWDMKAEEGYAVAVFVLYYVVFIAIAIVPTGGEQPWFYDKFARYELKSFFSLLLSEKKEEFLPQLFLISQSDWLIFRCR